MNMTEIYAEIFFPYFILCILASFYDTEQMQGLSSNLNYE